jgi:hypothetical protein
MSTRRLCFGTSTFVAGRLQPDKDSEPGIHALAQALSDGLEWVHSNPALRTQWAVRTAWQRAGSPALRHAVKVESPLDCAARLRSRVRCSLERSQEALGVPALQTAVIEIDLKGTHDLAGLVDPVRVSEFYREAASEVLGTGIAAEAYAYCHSAAHMAAALTVPQVSGLAAQFSPAELWPRIFFPDLRSRGLPFLGMAPLWRGRLSAAGKSATRPLGWVLSHLEVTRAVLTMSSVDHWRSALVESSRPYDMRREHSDFAAWDLEWPPDA